MKKFELSLLIGFVVCVFASSMQGFAQDCEYLRQNVLRIHILANSDSAEDQALKLAVRDNVLAASDEIFESSGNIEQAKENISTKMQRIEELAQQTIDDYGYNYTANAQLVNMYFDTRHYENFDMPAGRYEAVRVTIGQGEGKNWWCVAYPPMCIDACSADKPQASANAANTGEEKTTNKIISLSQTPVYKPKLAVVEAYEWVKENIFTK